MPEAAVDEDDGFVFGEDDVGPAREFFAGRSTGFGGPRQKRQRAAALQDAGARDGAPLLNRPGSWSQCRHAQPRRKAKSAKKIRQKGNHEWTRMKAAAEFMEDAGK